ncbi:MAG: tetratricopeptide repeat protein, partial [Candidatus Humimicrobiia bacterium]
MLEISNELISIYKDEIGEEYFRKIPEEVKLRADSLNNRALTLLDLGKINEAENIWRQALEIDSHHPEATCNLGLLNWRNAKITDFELVEQLESVIEKQEKNWRPYYLLGTIHLERGDKNSAEKMLRQAEEKLKQEEKLAPEVSNIKDALMNLTKIKNACYLRSFKGHKRYVNDIAIAPNGKYFVSASSDNTLKLWDINSGDCLTTFVGHEDSIYAVAITLDGKYVVSGSDDNTLKLWDINTGECLRTFEGHKGWVNCVVITTDGKYIVSGSNDNTLKLWDINTGECLRTFKGHKGWVKSIDVSKLSKPVGRTKKKQYIISGSDDGTIKLWDLNNGECLLTFEGHKYGINTIAFSKDDRYIISGSSDNTIKLWDLNSGECLRNFEGHNKAVKDLVITPDGGFIISGSLDDTLRLWDLNSSKCLRTFMGHEDDIHTVAITQDGNYMISSSKNDKLWLWRLEGIGDINSKWALNRPVSTRKGGDDEEIFNERIRDAKEYYNNNNINKAGKKIHEALKVHGYGRDKEALDLLHKVGIRGGKRKKLIDERCLHTFEGHKHRVNSIAISLDGRYAISSSSDRTLMLWDLTKKRHVHTYVGNKKNVEAVAISPDGKYVISGDDDMKLNKWDFKKKNIIHTFEGHKGSIKDVHVTPDGKFAISGSDDNTLKLWDLKSCECIQTFKGHKESVESVAITPDGEYVISGSEDMTLKLWDLSNGECLRTFEGHQDSVKTVRITPDGKYSVSGSDDMTLKLWNLTSGMCVRTFEGHEGAVEGVAISPDGKYIVSCSSWDNTLKLWNISNAKCLKSFKGHENSIYDIGISPDGRYIISCSSDKTIKLWQLDWDYEFPEEADWDEGVKPYLNEIFLNLHAPYSSDGIKREGKSSYTEVDFEELLKDLGYRGYGWLKVEKVRQKLKEMVQEWKAPQDLYIPPPGPPGGIPVWESEVKKLERLIEGLREVDDIVKIAKAYNDIGKLYFENKEYSQAKAVFKKVLKIQEERRDKGQLGFCYVNLGKVNMYQGNYNQAEIRFNKGLTYAEETNYYYLKAKCYQNLGILYDRYLNQPQDALRMYKDCLRIQKELEEPIPDWLEPAIQQLSKGIYPEPKPKIKLYPKPKPRIKPKYKPLPPKPKPTPSYEREVIRLQKLIDNNRRVFN